MLMLWVWQLTRPPQGIEASRTLPTTEGDRGPHGLSPTAFTTGSAGRSPLTQVGAEPDRFRDPHRTHFTVVTWFKRGVVLNTGIEVTSLLSNRGDLDGSVDHREGGQHRIQMGVDQISGSAHCSVLAGFSMARSPMRNAWRQARYAWPETLRQEAAAPLRATASEATALDDFSERLLGKQWLWSLAFAGNASHKMQEKLQVDPSLTLKNPVCHSISAIKKTAF